MIKAYKAEGIILGRRNFGEADKFITIFTKQFGKKLVLAKGIRRVTSRRAPYLELFSHVAIVLHQGKTFDILTEVNPIHTFTHIYQKLERIGFACVALELTEKLTAENQESYLIFAKLLTYLEELNDASATRKTTRERLLVYKHELLEELGFIRNDQFLAEEQMDTTIEHILERELKSAELLTSIQRRVNP